MRRLSGRTRGGRCTRASAPSHSDLIWSWTSFLSRIMDDKVGTTCDSFLPGKQATLPSSVKLLRRRGYIAPQFYSPGNIEYMTASDTLIDSSYCLDQFLISKWLLHPSQMRRLFPTKVLTQTLMQGVGYLQTHQYDRQRLAIWL